VQQGQEGGLEIGDQAGAIVIIQCALYGLYSSSCTFCADFAEFLCSWDSYLATCYDYDVWMQLPEEADGYEYIFTHVEDFKIVACNPSHWLNLIKGTFLVKSDGPPAFLLPW